MKNLINSRSAKSGTGAPIESSCSGRRPLLSARLRQRSQKAFSLVELTLAMGVSSFCLMSLLGVLPVGLETNHNSNEKTAAASLASSIVTDLRSLAKTPPTTDSPQYNLNFSSAQQGVYLSEDGTVVTNSRDARYLATVRTDGAATTAFVNIRITWPAAATVETAPGFYETTTAISRN
jgi:uncharacterized protein (TIGR02598 family)